MAKATKKAAPTREAAPNMFARAAKKSTEDKPKKKPKGTVLQLPKDLDAQGQLIGDSKILNEAVSAAITAKADEKAAKGRFGTAAGALHEHCEEAWCAVYAKNGVQPETPVVIQNHKGEKLTFVVQDKSGQNAITEDQVMLIGALLGEDVANSLIEERSSFGFAPATMAEVATGKGADGEELVQDVIAALVSEVLMSTDKLSDEQKAELITCDTKTYLRKNTLARLGELCGSNVGKIQAFLQAAGSAVVRYLKV